jgi:hypothetical protein
MSDETKTRRTRVQRELTAEESAERQFTALCKAAYVEPTKQHIARVLQALNTRNDEVKARYS